MNNNITGYPSIDMPWIKYNGINEDEIIFPKMSMKSYLFERNVNNLKRTAINYYGRKITYKELFDNIEQTKIFLSKKRINEGDVVSIAAPFLPEVVYSIYALNAMGMIVNLVDPRVPSANLLRILRESDSKGLIAIDICINKIREIESRWKQGWVILLSAMNSLPIGLRCIGKLKNSFAKKQIKISDKYSYWRLDANNHGNGDLVSDCIYRLTIKCQA